MKIKTRVRLAATVLLLGLLTLGAGAAEQDDAKDLPLDQIRLPDGFEITLFADDVPNARAMTLGAADGVVFVGSRRAGKVYAVVDRDGDFRADAVHLIDEDLTMPTGVAYKDGALYVGAISRVLRYDKIEQRLDDPPEPVVLIDTLPDKEHHGWKFIAFGPDGLLYVPVGAPCNICDPPEEIFASIARMKSDGSGLEIFVHGVRNTVGFDWHPKTGHLWFTDNGRDWMGDDIPPDELNVITGKGQHFGFPHCHGGDALDPAFGKGKDCADYVAPARKLDPHVAAIGMRFYDGEQFPDAYKGTILIAEHGSWNRSTSIGYRVTQVRVEGDKASSYDVFAEGWLPEGGNPWGRPADVEVLSDGSLLVSDDHAGVLYRIVYKP